MDPFFYDLEGDGERYSFDSDGFDEESICSWISEPESLCNVWRGWTWRNPKQCSVNPPQRTADGAVSSLIDLAAKAVSANIPFAVVESYPQPIPEDLQLKIAFWSFPDNEEDIRLYSCLANGSPDEFVKGEAQYRNGAVKDALQIGFHLSGNVCPPPTIQSNPQMRDGYRTSVVFDRQRITANNCTCDQPSWCQHIVALCLHRVNQADQVKLRAPISESLGRLNRSQLQKFAQYLIHELQDRQILPTAQRLLDELLSTFPSAINNLDGAPDPTAGPDMATPANWFMDQRILHENIKKTLVKFCVPSPVVYSDLNCLSSSAPPAAAEWQSLLRPLRGREPEGIWNLLSIVRELLRRRDSNAVPLLEILTDEMLQCEQLLVWWFTTKISSAHNNVTVTKTGGGNSSSSAQNAASSLCDEIVTLWRLVALNPRLSPLQRDDLRSQLETWHIMTLDKVRTAKCNNLSKKDDIELFPGFKSAYEMTLIDWNDYSIEGVTYSEAYPLYQSTSAVPGQTCLTSDSSCGASKISPITNYKVDNSKYSFANEQGFRRPGAGVENEDAEPHDDSSASEGFCDQEPRGADGGYAEGAERDSDWSDEGIKVNKDGYMAADDDSDLDVSANLPSLSNSSPSAHNPDEALGGAAAAALPLHSAAASEREALGLYRYDTTLRIDLPALDTSADEPDYFAGIKKWDDEREVLFARAEALHAHGYVQQACDLASRLTLDVLAEGEEQAKQTKTVKRQRSYSMLLPTMTFSNTPSAKTAFLCTVLLEESSYHHLAFKIGMYGLEMHREPAPNKALEVKLANLESELVGLLKRIPLGYAELIVIRSRAEQLKEGTLRSRGEAHLPLMLTTFIFESLSLPAQSSSGSNSAASSRPPSRCVQVNVSRQPGDEQLGFDAAVTALGLKANISEAEHPLICEGTRRQKGDLAVALLVQYKDDQYRLDKILEKLLDKDIHQMFKAPPISSYLAPGASGTGKPGSTSNARYAGSAWHDIAAVSNSLAGLSTDEARGEHAVRPKVNRNSVVRPSNLQEHPELEDLHSKDMEARLRCGLYGKLKRPSVGMAAVDSSAPETTSSDNSPTVSRRPFSKHNIGGGSDSESSGKSSDSVGSASSMPRPHRPRNTDSPGYRFPQPLYHDVRHLKGYSHLRTVKLGSGSRQKMTPTEPNQPSEALAHFMFELAKSLLQKAGGTSSTSLFSTQRENNPQTGPHRLLHICSFQVGLYALGINNCVSKNWLSRTYSSQASWIAGQTMELGTTAVHILLDTWEGHLTPTEVASLTDRASRGRDPGMVRAAAELALSCLAHAQALNPQEIRRALLQCKEQSNSMLEKACLAVESAAKDGSVPTEVLFDVARKWFELHEESQQNTVDAEPAANLQPANGAPPATVALPQPANMARQNNSPHMQMIAANPTMELMPAMATQSTGTVCRSYPPPVSSRQQGATYPIYNINPYAAVPVCYATNQYTAAQGAPQMNSAPGFVQAVPFAFNQTYPVTQMGGQVQGATRHVYHVYNGGQPGQQPNMLPVTGAVPTQMVPVNQQGMPAGAQAPVQQHQMHPQHQQQHHHQQQQQHHQHHQQQHQQLGIVPHPHQQQQLVLTQSPEQTNAVMSAFRVGVLAMETYGRRIIDDRPQAKYNRNPSCKEDIKWLLALSVKLGPSYAGPSYLQQFCQVAVNSLFSPFILYDIAIEVASIQSRNSPAQYQSVFRSPMLSSLMQRCLQMFIQCSHHRIHHIQPADYDEFVNIVSSARKAFNHVPSGMVQFQEMLQGLRRNKSCKKELWQRIVSGLSISS